MITTLKSCQKNSCSFNRNSCNSYLSPPPYLGWDYFVHQVGIGYKSWITGTTNIPGTTNMSMHLSYFDLFLPRRLQFSQQRVTIWILLNKRCNAIIISLRRRDINQHKWSLFHGRSRSMHAWFNALDHHAWLETSLYSELASDMHNTSCLSKTSEKYSLSSTPFVRFEFTGF